MTRTERGITHEQSFDDQKARETPRGNIPSLLGKLKFLISG